MTRWTSNKVSERLEEAAATLKRLPPVKVRGYFSVWPDILHDTDDKRDWEVQLRRLGPPSAKAISQMEETLTWFRFVTSDENRLVWLRANGVRWKYICWRMGCCRTDAWKQWVYALEKITHGLNNERSAKRHRPCVSDLNRPPQLDFYS